MSHSSRLADRLRRKTGEEMYNELKNVFDEDPMSFFGGWNSPHNSQAFSRAGFPFDEEVYPRRQDIRSHLDDLAQRHPEFADQLRGPPWGSDVGSPSHGTWGRKRRGSGDEEGRSQACGSGESRPTQSSEESTVPRGRPRQGPIPQYGLRNTVDLGQQQAQGMNEQEDRDGNRGQRSWSAPPDNRTAGAEQQAPQQPQQRFVSRINITPSSPGKPPPAPQKQQPQQTPSNVRHIPIFVEGRDEPLLPKHAEEPEQIFNQRIPPQPHQAYGYSQPQTFTTHHIPVQRQPPAHQQQQQHQQPKPAQQQKPQPVFTEAKGVQEERIPAQKIPVQQQQKQPEQVPSNDPISKVQVVQKDVENLQQIVEKYSGNSRQDKEYVYLDEMLTRNLLKLDDIDTEGKENVRQARKDVIKNIQRCISILESRVPVPEDQSKASSDPDEQMADSEAQLDPETERVPDEVPEKMEEDEAKGELGDVDMKEGSTNAAENVSTDVNPEEKMEISQLSGVELVTTSSEPVNMESEVVQNGDSAAENKDSKDDTNAPCEQPTENVESKPENPGVEVPDSLSEVQVPVNDAGDLAQAAHPVVESSDGLVVSEGGDKEQLKVEADPKKKKTGKKSKSPVKKSAKVTESKQENEVEKG